jgi:ATP-dependent RNA helicase MSS116
MNCFDQNKRTKTSNAFKDAKRAILFSSDVTARGMDYPDITTVIQVGVTTKEQYIHRYDHFCYSQCCII